MEILRRKGVLDSALSYVSPPSYQHRGNNLIPIKIIYGARKEPRKCINNNLPWHQQREHSSKQQGGRLVHTSLLLLSYRGQKLAIKICKQILKLVFKSCNSRRWTVRTNLLNIKI